MPGTIDGSTDKALYESYTSGRASAGDTIRGGSEFAQWSAVNDARTCDFCGWADERIFDVKFQPWTPPTHHGCRCLIAYILKEEFVPKEDWGKGPPDASFPPGRRNGVDKTGRPTRRNLGKTEIKKPAISEEGIVRSVSEWDKVNKGIDPNGPRAWEDFDPGDMAEWRDKSFKDILGGTFDEDAFKILDEFIEEWLAFTTEEAKLFATGMLSGDANIPELLKSWMTSMNEPLGESKFLKLVLSGDKKSIEVLSNHFQAQKRLAGELAKKFDNLEIKRGMFSLKKDDVVSRIIKAIDADDFDIAIDGGAFSSWTTESSAADFFASKARVDLLLENEFAFGSYEGGIVLKKAADPTEIFLSWLDHPSVALNGQAEVVFLNSDPAFYVSRGFKNKQGIYEVELY